MLCYVSAVWIIKILFSEWVHWNVLSFSKWDSFSKCVFIFKIWKVLWVLFSLQFLRHRTNCSAVQVIIKMLSNLCNRFFSLTWIVEEFWILVQNKIFFAHTFYFIRLIWTGQKSIIIMIWVSSFCTYVVLVLSQKKWKKK